MRALSTCLTVALLGGALLAGCGGTSKSTTSTVTNTASTPSNGASGSGSGTSGSGSGTSGSGTSTSGSGTSTSGSGTSTTSTGATLPVNVKRQIELCTKGVGSVRQLSAATKARLVKNCEKAGANGVAQRKIVHEVCEALAQTLPGALARERALHVCRSAP